jgi:hypothetical protein
VAARYQQKGVGEFQLGIGEARAQRVPLKVVDRDQRPGARHRQRLGGDEADHHPADQARARGGGDGVAIGQYHPGIAQYRLDQRRQLLGMGAGGNLGNDAAIGCVGRFLRGNPLRKNASVARHQRRRGFVAAALDAQDYGFGTSHPGFP